MDLPVDRTVKQDMIRFVVAMTAFTSGSWFNINSGKVTHEMTMTCNKLYVVEIRLEEFWDLRFWEKYLQLRDKPTTRRCFFEIAERLSSEIAIIVVKLDLSKAEKLLAFSVSFQEFASATRSNSSRNVSIDSDSSYLFWFH
ncbi:hypothetical protein DERF_010304 [Dermatophagoides farinae]|uniref:Uncharacterized protein n=1 Tax=Dermatophagoides farinae TaxID=6954 RepID=A0A922HVM8_DERFA|nr:hypothetical protein DERF_010304 [Dermatophagoides farinae]